MKSKVMEKTVELRKQDTKKLQETLNKKENELMEGKIMYTVGKSKDISIFGKIRKEIARIKTVLKEKEILASSQDIAKAEGDKNV